MHRRQSTVVIVLTLVLPWPSGSSLCFESVPQRTRGVFPGHEAVYE